MLTPAKQPPAGRRERHAIAAARMRMLLRLLALPVSAISAAPLTAQPPLAALAPADGRLDDGFSHITGVRELRDGRLLVADEKVFRLFVADWSSGQVLQVGRKGRGPAEYRGLLGLMPLAGDSTLVEDVGNERWLLLDGARIVATVNYQATRGRSAADPPRLRRAGAVVAVEPFAFSPTPRGEPSRMYIFAESLRVILEDRTTGRRDLLGRIRGRSRGDRHVMHPVVPGGAPIVWVIGNPLAVEEQARLFPDGWVAVAWLDPYRVDWRRPDGRWIRGAPLPFEHVPVDAHPAARRARAASTPRRASAPATCHPGRPNCRRSTTTGSSRPPAAGSSSAARPTRGSAACATTSWTAPAGWWADWRWLSGRRSSGSARDRSMLPRATTTTSGGSRATRGGEQKPG